MKKGLIFMVLLLAFVIVAKAEDKTPVQLKAGVQTILALDTIGAADSIRVPVYFWTGNQEGVFHFFYRVRGIAGNVKAKIYYEYALDTLWGWYNRTLLDSIVAAESTLVMNPGWITGQQWIRFPVKGFGAAGDTSSVFLGLQAIPK